MLTRKSVFFNICLTGDPVLSHLEWQPETVTLHLQPGEKQPGSVTAHLQDLCQTGGRGRTDIPAAHGYSGGSDLRKRGRCHKILWKKMTPPPLPSPSVVPDSATTLAPAVRRKLPTFLPSGTLCLSLARLHPTEDLRQSGRPQRSRV